MQEVLHAMTRGLETIITVKCACGKDMTAYNVQGLCATKKHLLECKAAEQQPLTYFWLYMIGEIIKEWRYFA